MNTITRGEDLNPIPGEPGATLIQFEIVDNQADLVDRFAVIQTRAETVTVLLEEVLHTCPPPRWAEEIRV